MLSKTTTARQEQPIAPANTQMRAIREAFWRKVLVALIQMLPERKTHFGQVWQQ